MDLHHEYDNDVLAEMTKTALEKGWIKQAIEVEDGDFMDDIPINEDFSVGDDEKPTDEDLPTEEDFSTEDELDSDVFASVKHAITSEAKETIEQLITLANELDQMGATAEAVSIDKQLRAYRNDVGNLLKQSDEKLYDIFKETGESLINSAHPGGGVTIAPATDEGGKVGTIVEEQKKMIDKATKAPTGKLASTISELVSLASRLDSEGKEEAAHIVDKTIRDIVRESPFAGRDLAIEASNPNDNSASIKKEALEPITITLLTTLAIYLVRSHMVDELNEDIEDFIDIVREFMGDYGAETANILEEIEPFVGVFSTLKSKPTAEEVKLVIKSIEKFRSALRNITKDVTFLIKDSWFGGTIIGRAASLKDGFKTLGMSLGRFQSRVRSAMKNIKRKLVEEQKQKKQREQDLLAPPPSGQQETAPKKVGPKKYDPNKSYEVDYTLSSLNPKITKTAESLQEQFVDSVRPKIKELYGGIGKMIKLIDPTAPAIYKKTLAAAAKKIEILLAKLPQNPPINTWKTLHIIVNEDLPKPNDGDTADAFGYLDIGDYQTFHKMAKKAVSDLKAFSYGIQKRQKYKAQQKQQQKPQAKKQLGEIEQSRKHLSLKYIKNINAMMLGSTRPKMDAWLGKGLVKYVQWLSSLENQIKKDELDLETLNAKYTLLQKHNNFFKRVVKLSLEQIKEIRARKKTSAISKNIISKYGFDIGEVDLPEPASPGTKKKTTKRRRRRVKNQDVLAFQKAILAVGLGSHLGRTRRYPDGIDGAWGPKTAGAWNALRKEIEDAGYTGPAKIIAPASRKNIPKNIRKVTQLAQNYSKLVKPITFTVDNKEISTRSLRNLKTFDSLVEQFYPTTAVARLLNRSISKRAAGLADFDTTMKPEISENLNKARESVEETEALPVTSKNEENAKKLLGKIQEALNGKVGEDISLEKGKAALNRIKQMITNLYAEMRGERPAGASGAHRTHGTRQFPPGWTVNWDKQGNIIISAPDGRKKSVTQNYFYKVFGFLPGRGGQQDQLTKRPVGVKARQDMEAALNALPDYNVMTDAERFARYCTTLTKVPHYTAGTKGKPGVISWPDTSNLRKGFGLKTTRKGSESMAQQFFLGLKFVDMYRNFISHIYAQIQMYKRQGIDLSSYYSKFNRVEYYLDHIKDELKWKSPQKLPSIGVKSPQRPTTPQAPAPVAGKPAAPVK